MPRRSSGRLEQWLTILTCRALPGCHSNPRLCTFSSTSPDTLVIIPLVFCPTLLKQRLNCLAIRSILDLHQLGLQHYLQNHVHLLLRIRDISHAQRLQTDARPQSRHLQGPVSSRCKRRARNPPPLQVHPFRGQDLSRLLRPLFSCLTFGLDPMGILHLAWIRRHPASTFHATKDRGSGDDYDALPLRPRGIPRTLHPQLDI